MPLLPLTNVPLHIIHLTSYKHLSRSPQLVFGLVEDLLIHHPTEAPGLAWVGPVVARSGGPVGGYLWHLHGTGCSRVPQHFVQHYGIVPR